MLSIEMVCSNGSVSILCNEDDHHDTHGYIWTKNNNSTRGDDKVTISNGHRLHFNCSAMPENVTFGCTYGLHFEFHEETLVRSPVSTTGDTPTTTTGDTPTTTTTGDTTTPFPDPGSGHPEPPSSAACPYMQVMLTCITTLVSMTTAL